MSIHARPQIGKTFVPRGNAGGFSLVEMLFVIAIMTVLMGAGNVLFHSPISKAAEPAARLARCIEMARAQAIATNRNVALRFDEPQADKRELVLRFMWSRPGETVAAGAKQEYRRPERFADMVIAKSSSLPGLSNGLPAAHDLAAGESLVITTDGQVLLGSGTTGFPVAADELQPLIHLGVQPTVAGKVVPSVANDVAIVQIQCASGTARIMQP